MYGGNANQSHDSSQYILIGAEWGGHKQGGQQQAASTMQQPLVGTLQTYTYVIQWLQMSHIMICTTCGVT